MEKIIILFSKISGHDLARFGLDIDPKLKGEARAKEISRQLMENCIDWREDDNSGTDKREQNE